MTVNLGQDIGGPSAGTAFALAIYDKLTPGPLLDGKHVAGTGTIDALGQVGAIGGIQQKIAGAKNDGATVFLVPAPELRGGTARRCEGHPAGEDHHPERRDRRIAGGHRRKGECPRMHTLSHLYAPASRSGDLPAWIP